MYIIRFAFPEGDKPFAALSKGAFGFGPEPHVFDAKEEAENVLKYAFGETSRPFGEVVAYDGD